MQGDQFSTYIVENSPSTRGDPSVKLTSKDSLLSISRLKELAVGLFREFEGRLQGKEERIRRLEAELQEQHRERLLENAQLGESNGKIEALEMELRAKTEEIRDLKLENRKSEALQSSDR